MILVILIILTLMNFGSVFVFPEPRYRVGGGILGVLCLVLTIAYALGYVHN
jgi:hypothetical protein